MAATFIVVRAMRRVDPWIETHCESDIPHLMRPIFFHTPSHLSESTCVLNMADVHKLDVVPIVLSSFLFGFLTVFSVL